MKKIVWRLKEQPTSESLQGLVKNGILTKEEAREILFSSETEEDRDKKSLESEVKFLRELVEKLSKRSQIVEVIKEIRVPYYHNLWYQPYQDWCGITYDTSVSTTTNAGEMSLTGGITGANCLSNFSSISTF